MKFCDLCGKPFDDDVLVCDDCGFKFPLPEKPGYVTCPQCKAQFRDEERVCPYCGAFVVVSEKSIATEAKKTANHTKAFFWVVAALSLLSVYALFAMPILESSLLEISMVDLLEMSADAGSSTVTVLPIWMLLAFVLCAMCAISALMRFRGGCLCISAACGILILFVYGEVSKQLYMEAGSGFWIPLLCMISSFICSFAIDERKRKES